MSDLQSIDLHHWDYLVIDCGYIDRLYNKADDIIERLGGINEETKEHPLIFFMDYEYHGEDKPITYSKFSHQPDVDRVYVALKRLCRKKALDINGAVCFRNPDYQDEDPLNVLISYQHCGCFGREAYKIYSFTTKTGKKVLVKHFDTESG